MMADDDIYGHWIVQGFAHEIKLAAISSTLRMKQLFLGTPMIKFKTFQQGSGSCFGGKGAQFT